MINGGGAGGAGHEMLFTSSQAMEHGALETSLTGGMTTTSLQYAPRLFGRSLYGFGIVLMLVGGWLGYATYAQPSLHLSEMASARVAVASSSTTGQPTPVHGVAKVRVAAPGRYGIVVRTEGTDGASVTREATPDYDRVSEQFVRPFVEEPREAVDGVISVPLHDRQIPAGTGTVIVYAVPLQDPPTIVHIPTIRRDLIIFGIGFVLFTVGMVLRRRSVAAQRRFARAIEAGLAGASGAPPGPGGRDHQDRTASDAS